MHSILLITVAKETKGYTAKKFAFYLCLDKAASLTASTKRTSLMGRICVTVEVLCYTTQKSPHRMGTAPASWI